MPEHIGQGNLFEGLPEDRPPVSETAGVDANEFAEIRNNPLVRDLSGVYKRKKTEEAEEAAAAQGWGPVADNPAQHTETTVVGSSRLFELPGLATGRNNEHNQSVNAGVAQKGLSLKEIDKQNRINQAGATSGLEILRHSPE